MGFLGKRKQNPPIDFSDALNREKAAKDTKVAAPLQPRGSKVAADIVADIKSPGATKKTNIGTSKAPEMDAKGIYSILVQTRQCEELCLSLGLTMSDIRKMKRKYNDNDMYHSGEITQAEFFFMINEDRRPLSVGIFKFADIPDTQKFISFDQYLLCVVNFAVLTKPELYQFVFDLYDADQSGGLDDHEFLKMSVELQSKQFNFSANVGTAIKMLEGREDRAAFAPDDGLMDLGEFMKFAKNFPVAFYPILNMQKNVRTSTLGGSRWSRITANKLKVQELVRYMRRHQGAIPELTLFESVANIFTSDVFNNRKRAGELYARELAQRRLISTREDDFD
ncbi:hypothetical protein PHMEG_0001743 [Phytophthora megakarya]|uniref:EF-hand domain-containing protein n=1 Tax=Phytophthora megakarya TaxID=4795 RepID=A0A225X0V9_9STRA|nr:hypothetical protein PHMEG_0001743 [Phytophthora megakarya]